MSRAGSSANFEITDAKLHVPIVTLSTKDSVNLTKQLSEGFKKSVYWDGYQTKPAKVIEKGKIYTNYLMNHFKALEDSFLAYVVTSGAENDEAGIKDNKKYFFSKKRNCNVLTDGRHLYDQPISNLIKQYHEVRKVSTVQNHDYTTSCLLDYAYLKDNYKLIPVDLSKQKDSDADPRAIQQIVLQGLVGGDDNTKIRLCTILEQSKETLLEFL